ncbi:PREDICTED: uncharacterized protein LOC107347465 isoform X2 [Acropora digitifera]|uniref:uncharacterized protein LOC107347465 isoform X2 n=1 Tax=Acropora digitifera TaxID=70779 RepID=UPI00077A2274|nr:PREDICTED: uncharacterized protein LOC107347465 isoform X2 [Acropora digitifera]
MAAGSSGLSTIVILPSTRPGTPASPTVLPAPSTASGIATESSFNLDDNHKRWMVIGICLNKILLPPLRDFVAKEIPKHYIALKNAHKIDTQVCTNSLPKDGVFMFNYGSINSNWKRKKASYNYNVSSAEELARLYLEPKMAKFTGFDNTCDLSAVLGILANAACFSPDIQRNAKDVRSKVRNEWGHCNFNHWTDVHFAMCFQVMETMIRSLRLAKADEEKHVDSLQDWETKGLTMCMGCPVDKDLMHLVTVEVSNLEEDLKDLKTTSEGEAKEISNALQSFKDEADNYFKRIEENQKALSAAISDTANDISKNAKRLDGCDESISLLEERQSNLEETVVSVKDKQVTLSSEVGALKTEQSQLASRVRALEEITVNAVAGGKIVQVPSRNSCFCGRHHELETIAAHARICKGGFTHSAICGLGGVGKTSLVVEFLCQYEEDYPGGIFWISGENNEVFQRSLNEVARQLGTFQNDFSVSLSKTLEYLRRQKDLWCLVVDNLDELKMSPDMKKLLTGHWKHKACGHIIVTTRREVVKIGEDLGIDERYCIELKCLTSDEGIQFLAMRTGKVTSDDKHACELVCELGGLPLALDQAGAYIRCLDKPMKEYLKQYQKQRSLLLEKMKARNLVENTADERLAVHTTWLMNFEHIAHLSKEQDLGQAPKLLMQICAFFGPDDIPYELINQEIYKEDHSTMCDQAEIVSLLTKFSLFQRYSTNSFSVHRLVQEVIRCELRKETDSVSEMDILSYAVRVLHFALEHALSPASVCQSFSEDAVFSLDNPPSLHLWSKLALHATYLQEHLCNLSKKQKVALNSFLHTDEIIRIFNEAGVFFAVSQENIKAQEMQKLKLELLVKNDSSQDSTALPDYFLDVPLRDRDCKLISHCMRQPPTDCGSIHEGNTSQMEKEKEANYLREQGNREVKNNRFTEALNLYSKAIDLSTGDYRLFSNRSLCYLKLGDPQKALEDCDKCLSLKSNFPKAFIRKAWALDELVKSGSTEWVKRVAQKKAMMALALHLDSSLSCDKKWSKMFQDEPGLMTREVTNESQLAFALMTTQACETLLLHEGEYNLSHFITFTDFQILGLGQGAVLRVKKVFKIFSRIYFENIALPKGNAQLVCTGKDAAIHVNRCDISGGSSSCEDFPECNGGPGCIAASLGKPTCNRSGKFGVASAKSGVPGFPGVDVHKSSAQIENCSVHDCGGGGILVSGEGSQSLVRKCDIYKNHQAGLEAREGGKLVAVQSRIFSNGFHGILIGPKAGECNIDGNKIFENASEGIYADRNESKIAICNNDIHHNGPFGISLAEDSCLLICRNKIFENGFSGILAKSRTSAIIRENLISNNKCGGIHIGANYSGRIQLESNVICDHSGPWLQHDVEKDSIRCDGFSPEPFGYYLPPGENQIYTHPPILSQNKIFNNIEGMNHPREVAGRIYSGCTFCHRSKDEVQRLLKCPKCHIATYCGKECQKKHWPTHRALCRALKGRYSITADILTTVGFERGTPSMRTFGGHLKGIGTGPKPKRNSCKEFIVKIQTQNLNSHPLQLLIVYDKSLALQCSIQSPEVFSVIKECGVLGALNKFTSKKAFFWAMFAEGGEKLTIFLDHLAPYQEW